jgi:hypothetical protein
MAAPLSSGARNASEIVILTCRMLAKTRAGAPCIMRVVPGKRRCRFHGGPKTKAGRVIEMPSNAVVVLLLAFILRSDLLDTGDGAGNHFIKPAPTTRDRCDQRGARLGANRSTVVWGQGSRHEKYRVAASSTT